MRLAELDGRMVRTADGKRLGRVHEVRARGGKVVALDYGAGSWIERLAGKGRRKSVAWDKVREVTGREIVVEA